MSTVDARSPDQHGGFWRNQTFHRGIMIDRIWGDSRHS
jgi:hypothetical protein